MHEHAWYAYEMSWITCFCCSTMNEHAFIMTVQFRNKSFSLQALPDLKCQQKKYKRFACITDSCFSLLRKAVDKIALTNQLVSGRLVQCRWIIYCHKLKSIFPDNYYYYTARKCVAWTEMNMIFQSEGLRSFSSPRLAIAAAYWTEFYVARGDKRQ